MCCEAIVLSLSKEQLAKATGPDAVFIVRNWEEISRMESYTRNPHLISWRIPEGWHFYRCAKLEGKRCSVQSEKPPVCSEYPWYGQLPNPFMYFYSESCGYKKDSEEHLKQSMKS